MSLDSAVRRAAAAAAGSVGRGHTDSDISAMIERFGEHPDGYLHARIVVDGRRFYFHRKFGSWLAPGQVGSHAVLKEPEGLLGRQLGGEIKYKLSALSKPYDNRRRLAREEETRHANERDTSAPANSGSDSETGSADRLPGGAHSVGADDEVRPD